MNREKESEVEEDFSDCFSFEPEVTKPKPTGIYYDLESQSFTTKIPCSEIMIIDDAVGNGTTKADMERIQQAASRLHRLTKPAKTIVTTIKPDERTHYEEMIKFIREYREMGGTVTGRIKSKHNPPMHQMPRTVKDPITGTETYTPQIQKKYVELEFDQGHRTALAKSLNDVTKGIPHIIWGGVFLRRHDIEKILSSLDIADTLTYRVPLQD